ncbi:glycosyl hydrolase family 18 protein [Thalassotalea sp. 1_MG-2023]|uniref:glycosyl hydrolase family 18 protein n=1 Tax=Thalassotalea sp. 1_MG-2023 TaxID=3062680 RepID=UPI0026E2528A|nr:glycosyl hydrolase family 18 protein [Thalassotalea sp. 1_MG-2023]MDO6427267.1 glycosyl hydrolase family 18 protein [Thalassotalea sp. 1_MG-2023]
MYKCLKNIFVAVGVMLVLPISGHATPKIIGYIPSYHGIESQLDRINLSKLTHLTLAFLHPNKQGVFIENNQPSCMAGQHGFPLKISEIEHLLKKAHDSNVKVLVSIGGAAYPLCAGDWRKLLSPENRDKTIKNLLAFVHDLGFDGLDIDIESRMLTDIDNKGDFLPFVKLLKENLMAHEKILTAATGSYLGGMIPESTLPHFDLVSVMSYDAVGPTWGKVGVEHSTLAKAKADLALWRSKGLSKEQLILGLPFYGYGFGKYKKNYTFDDILGEFGPNKSKGDLIGTNCAKCDYITFNGYQTIKAKTELALKQGAGVMIWELSQDVPASMGLLHIINETINNNKKENR